MHGLVAEGRQIAQRQFYVALIATLLITSVIYICCGLSFAKSAFYGGLISIIPHMVFAYKAFKYAGAQSSKKVMESFFTGEKLKMALTAFLFALAFKYLLIVPVPFFVTYFLVMFLTLLTPVFFKL